MKKGRNHNEMSVTYDQFEKFLDLYYRMEDESERKIYKSGLSNLFVNYEGIMNICDIFENIFMLRSFHQLVLKKIELGSNREDILSFFNLTEYQVLIRFLLDIYLPEDTESEESVESDVETISNVTEEESSSLATNVSKHQIHPLQDKEEPEEEIEEFVWKPNQLEGIENAIAMNFISGIHSQATGTGKSLMALKIMWEYHKRNPTHSMMWLCERKDIPSKLFFDTSIDPETNEMVYQKQYKKWKHFDIINMWNFDVLNLATCKPKNWVSLINEKKDKPKFIVVNRAFLTTTSKVKGKIFRYQEIDTESAPLLIVHDECHSAPAHRTYELMIYMKEQWKSKMQGLSATPYREGSCRKEISELVSNEKKWNVVNNMNRLIQIYPHPTNPDYLHILSKCELRKAIEEGYIVEPVFHWFYTYTYDVEEEPKKPKNFQEKQWEIEGKSLKTITFQEDELESMMSALNTMMSHCTYKKVLIWCRLVTTAENMYMEFNKRRDQYDQLKDITSFIYHSRMVSTMGYSLDSKEKTQYDDFYDFDLETNHGCIMFCANMFREGSDIPNLCGALFLDKVKERSDIPFIQSIGRVLRTDPLGVKQNGHILDCCQLPKIEEGENEEMVRKRMNQEKVQMILNKLIKYYLKLYEFSKWEVEMGGEYKPDISKLKVKKYVEIMNSFKMNPETHMIEIHLKNEKKVSIDMKEMKLERMDWTQLLISFERHWERQFDFNDHEDFMKLEYLVRQKKFENIQQYVLNHKKYGFPEKPNMVYQTYWKNWYDFLGMDTSMYPKTKEEWIECCKALEVQSYDHYLMICDQHQLPRNPDQLYIAFSNFNSELGLDYYELDL